MLHKLHPFRVHLRAGVGARDNDHHGRGGADQNCINIDCKCLDQALLGGVGRAGGGGGLWGVALAGAVGKDTALNALDQSRSQGAAKHSVQAKGALKDGSEESGDLVVMNDQDGKR